MDRLECAKFMSWLHFNKAKYGKNILISMDRDSDIYRYIASTYGPDDIDNPVVFGWTNYTIKALDAKYAKLHGYTPITSLIEEYQQYTKK